MDGFKLGFMTSFLKSGYHKCMPFYIFKEGDNSEKFVVIKNGEFEIAKTDLRNVYFNKTSGIVGIKEANIQGTMIRSTNPINQNITLLENSLG